MPRKTAGTKTRKPRVPKEVPAALGAGKPSEPASAPADIARQADTALAPGFEPGSVDDPAWEDPLFRQGVQEATKEAAVLKKQRKADAKDEKAHMKEIAKAAPAHEEASFGEARQKELDERAEREGELHSNAPGARG